MNPETYFCIDTVQTAHELIDGEVVVIHLRHGSYHNLNPIGAWLWAALLQGATPAGLVRQLQTLPAAPAQLDDVVLGFLTALQQAELLALGLPACLPPPLAVLPPASYSPPQVETYTDMQALLLLDPVHEVDATGWPKPQA